MLTKKLIRFLFDEVMTQQFVDRNNSSLITKSEFVKFVQAFRRDILEGEIADMFLALLKKLAVSQQVETANKDLKKGNALN
jgi:phosphoserine phosphatase